MKIDAVRRSQREYPIQPPRTGKSTGGASRPKKAALFIEALVSNVNVRWPYAALQNRQAGANSLPQARKGKSENARSRRFDDRVPLPRTKKKQISTVEITKSYLERIGKLNP
jgi:hypothetical protein